MKEEKKEDVDVEVVEDVSTSRRTTLSGRFSVFGFGGVSAAPPLLEPTNNTASTKLADNVTNTTIYMEGFLMKRARGVLMRGLQNWKARWFVLSEDIVTNPNDNSIVSSTYKLTYYKDAYNQKDAPSEEKGCFVFDKYAKIESLEESGEFRHIMVLSRGEGVTAAADGLGRIRRNSIGGLSALGLGDDSNSNPYSLPAAESEEKGDGREIVLSAVDSDTENKWLDVLSKVIRKAFLAENTQHTADGGGFGKQQSVEAAARAKRAAAASAGRGKTSRRLRVDGPAGVSNVPKLSAELNQNQNQNQTQTQSESSTDRNTQVNGNGNKWDDDSEDDESVCGDVEVDASKTTHSTVVLPPGWVEVQNGSVVYYYHTKARVSRWEVPTPEVAAELEARLVEEERQAVEAAKVRMYA